MGAESGDGTRDHYNPVMLLAGDLGGTKTLLGLFERGEPRPRHITSRAYPTQEFDSFTAILDAFAQDVGRLPRAQSTGATTVDAAAVGVAGPIVNRSAKLTNIAWDVSAAEITRRLNTPHVALLNDLEAMAYSVGVLDDAEVVVLQRGERNRNGNAAVIAAGTGLGQAYLHFIDGHLLPVASEGGHADFAARTDREYELVRMLRTLYGRAEVEQVLSGPGLVNLHRFTHDGTACEAVEGLAPLEQPPAISEAGLTQRCAHCVEALEMFVEAYGAEAGNLGLRGVATAGVFVGGGIAPKILPALQDGRFMQAFRAKTPLADLVSAMPVNVIVNPDAGLLGAAVAAQAVTGSNKARSAASTVQPRR
ncbi:MAG: glucokinase [Acidobacteria bacterium]|nr:MAG: glucokinase [Acidobacteriota bacterium]